MIISRDISIEELNIADNDIASMIGIGQSCQIDESTQNIIDIVKNELFSIAKPKFCFTIAESINFRCGKIISEALKDGDRFGIIVATAGSETENYLASVKGDIVKSFIADAIASEIAEATSKKAIKVLEGIVSPQNVSNPYSPGYCGWNLNEQRKLFGFFDSAPCGVTLNDSCLMLPIKSVSSVVAIGNRIQKREYGCAICNKTDCYKRRIV